MYLYCTLSIFATCCQGFVLRPSTNAHSTPRLGPLLAQEQERNNIFQNIFGAAFANDESLIKDSVEGAIDQGDDDDTSSSTPQLTATQQAWRQSQTAASIASLDGYRITLDLYLTGVPNKDPSNDLFAAKTNISSRDRAVGQELPADPSVSGLVVAFGADSCWVVQDTSGFGVAVVNSKADMGEWRLSDDGTQVRFRIPVRGYKRTIATKGTIQKVYWSTEEERSTQTQTVYEIPEGWLYGEAQVKGGVGARSIQWSEGVLKVEQAVGLLGVGSKMVPCGKFVVTQSTVGADLEKAATAEQVVE